MKWKISGKKTFWKITSSDASINKKPKPLGREWLYLDLPQDEINEDYDLYRNGDKLNEYWFNEDWSRTVKEMKATRVSCKDLREFHESQGNYSEKDIPDSTDLYGVSKKLGEINYQKCLTLRTSVIGFELENKTGLFEWILTNKNKTLSGFNKAFYNGFTTLELSKIILRLINLNLPIEGLYNLSSNKISKFSLLNLIIKNFKLDKKLIKNDTFYCDRTLNSKKFFKKIKYKVPNWNKMISDMKKLKNDIKK